MKKCKRCGKKFKLVGVGTKREKKFCSKLCQTRYGAYKRWLKLKDTPEYKKMQKINFNKWLKKNRKHFNDLMREPNKLYHRRKTAEARKKGHCISCFTAVPEEGYTSCSKCLADKRRWYSQKKITRSIRKLPTNKLIGF